MPKMKLEKEHTQFPGFINGTKLNKEDPIQFIKDSQVSRKHYKITKMNLDRSKKIKSATASIILALILFILPLSAYMMDIRQHVPIIYIDGEFEDWENIKSYYDSNIDQPTNPSTNLLEFKITESKSDLFFLAKVYEKMFDRLTDKKLNDEFLEVYSLYIFMDGDFNEHSGYYINGLGADHMIKITGRNGVIDNSQIFYFDSMHNSNDWYGWEVQSRISASIGRNQIEMQIPRIFLGDGEFALSLQIKDSRNNEDTFDYIIGYKRSCINVRFLELFDDEAFIPGFETKNTEITIANFEIYSSGPDTTLRDIRLHLETRENPGVVENLKLRITARDRSEDKSQVNKILTDFEVRISKFSSTSDILLGPKNLDPLKFVSGSCYLFELYLDTTSQLNVDLNFLISIGIDSFFFDTGKVYYVNANSPLQIQFAQGSSEEPIVIDGLFGDWSKKDGNSDRDQIPVGNKNIDIDKYKIFPDENFISFYFSVKGSLFEGTSIPELPALIPNTKKQTIGAGSPINNIDSEPTIKRLGLDMPGEDKAYIFINSDSETETGYKTESLPLGAEFMIEITGKNGEIIKRNLKRYTGVDEGHWSWEPVTEIEVASDYKRVELRCTIYDLGIEPGNKWSYFIMTSDWSRSFDNAGGAPINSRANPPTLPENLQTMLDNSGSSRAPDYGNMYSEKKNTRSIKIGNSTTPTATADNNQYKLVRDMNGIWYAFWQNSSGVLAANSTSSSGTSWNPEFVLVGKSGKAVDTANTVAFASVAIYYDNINKKDEIHMVCQYNTDDLLFTKLTDLDDFTNKSGNAWKVANETRAGFELIDGSAGLNILAPTLSINSTGVSHVVWTQSAFNTKVFYTHATTDGWTEPVVLTNYSAIASGIATIEIDGNDDLHLAWLNTTTLEINYKRCPNSYDSTNRSNWRSADRKSEYDKVLFSTNSMHYPSMVADSNNNIWVVAHEVTVYDIWFNKCTGDNWSTPRTIATTDDLRYPVIGADENGNVHVVWLNVTTGEVIYVFNSDKWSGNFSFIGSAAGTKYYPTLERHIRGHYNLSGVIFTNSSSKDISFEYIGDTMEIPELSNYSIVLVLAIITGLSVIKSKNKKRKNLNELE